MKGLHDIVQKLSYSSIEGNIDKKITHITADSRTVESGSLFICLEGATVDGHSFVGKAVKDGAVAIIASKPISVPSDVTVIYVENTRLALQESIPYFYDYPASKMRMIGVTGTNGKTTTTHIIAHILREQGYTVGIIGTVHIVIDNQTYPINNTTPDVSDLQKILQQMVDAGVTHCIMEVSSHALELGRTAGVEYDTAVFTNLTQDHLDFHKTFDNYLAAKSKLFKQLSVKEQVKHKKGAVINIDDPYGQAILDVTDVPVITYSTTQESNLWITNLNIQSKSTAFELQYDTIQYDVNVQIAGLFNVYNTLASIGACLHEGIPMEAIVKSLTTFTAVPGRFELIEEGQDFAVVVDYAHTPDGLENILQTAKNITDKRIIVVFGCGGDRDRTKRPIMGRIAAEYGDYVIVTSDNPRSEDPERILEDIVVGVQETSLDDNSYAVVMDRREAIFQAVEEAKTGDIVIIAGKGHEDYQILKDETIHFDDREVAREALKRR